MKRFLLLLLALYISIAGYSQLEVKPGSFKEVPGFVNINPDPNYQADDNELPFAVIKVRTESITDKQRRELKFEGNGGTFIMIEYKTGEVWVYLTAKYADYLKISHPDFSSTEFTFPFDLESKKGYEMTLVNNEKIETGVGSLTIRTQPDGAMITLNDININQQTPYVNDMMAAGTYTVTVSKSKYKSETRTVKLENGAKETVVIDLVYDIADITVKVDNDAEVYIDGVMRRKGTWIGELESGIHTIECRKLYHKPVIKTITVVANRPQTYTLVPTPIYGNVEINTEPQGANVFIDNRYYGTSPLIINQIIIGTHEMTIEKSGYKPLETTIFLEECNNLVINEVLSVGMANRTFTVNGISFEMVAVEGGTFMMGTQNTNYKGVNYGRGGDESPAHQVTLSDYYIGKFEVTQDLWVAVMGKNPKNMIGDNYPLYGFTWYEALYFCNELSEKCGRTPYYIFEEKIVKRKEKVIEVVIDSSSNGFRLPTEAEWEYAARGGNKSRGYVYSGSNKIEDVASFIKVIEFSWGGLGKDDYKMVGTKKPNELGIYDMSGNVPEWCYDRYGKYSSEGQINPIGANEGDKRVVRGGGYITNYDVYKRSCSNPNEITIKIAKRVYVHSIHGEKVYDDKEFGDNIGFRLVVNQ